MRGHFRAEQNILYLLFATIIYVVNVMDSLSQSGNNTNNFRMASVQGIMFCDTKQYNLEN